MVRMDTGQRCALAVVGNASAFTTTVKAKYLKALVSSGRCGCTASQQPGSSYTVYIETESEHTDAGPGKQGPHQHEGIDLVPDSFS